MVLFCFIDTYSLPLTRSCYTPPEDKIDIGLKEEFIYLEDMKRKDGFSFNLGIPGDTSIGLDFSILHSDSLKAGDGKPGDILFNFWHFTGVFFDETVSSGISLVVRIPTGPDAYSDESYRNLAFGNNEFKINPVLQFNFTKQDSLILNLSYIFREGRGEDLYDGFKINPLKSETYRACIGLNPFYNGSFLDKDNFKNDYFSVAAGFITSRQYPWILFTEIYYSSRLYMWRKSADNINIEGENVNPLLVSIGAKYFFNKSFFIQLSDVVSILHYDRYMKNTVEFSMNIFF